MGSVKYHNVPTSERDLEGQVGEEEEVVVRKGPGVGRIKLVEREERIVEQGIILKLVSHLLTLCSYTVFICLFPLTYWFCIKKINDTERIIIFRLGALIGSRGPGRVLVFPWIDRTQTVYVANSAFSVPPQQLITHDGGIIEIGAEVHYAVVDCVALVREVADHQEMIRSLARTILLRLIIKKNIDQLVKDKQSSSLDVMKEINGQVRKWGLDIRAVVLSDVKVLKSPVKEGGIPPLLASLGHTTQTLSPAAFAKYIYSIEEEEETGNLIDIQDSIEEAEQGKTSWSVCLQNILETEKIESENIGTYTLILADVGTKLLMTITETSKTCCIIDKEVESDVCLTLTSSDLAGILKGSLPPLQAYLSNRIQITGDVRKLMFLEKMGNKTHKPGQTFHI